MSIVVSIDLGNSNSMFSITTKQSSVMQFNCSSMRPSNEKYCSDLYVTQLKNKKKVVRLATSNTSFFSRGQQNQVCLSNYKGRLSQLVEENRVNIFQPEQLIFLTDGYKFQLDNVITTAYGLIVGKVYDILVSDSQFGYSSTIKIKWVITVPSMSTNGMQILMRECMFSAVTEHQKSIEDQTSFLAVQLDDIFTIQEPVAAFFQIKYERQLQLQNDSKIFVLDFGGSSIDISVFNYSFAQGIPILLGQVGLNYGGSYIDNNLTNVLRDSMGIEVNLAQFIQQFQKQKHDIFTQDDIVIELYDFDFDVNEADNSISALSNHLAFDPDDKSLLVDRQYFQDFIDYIVKQVTIKLTQQFKKFGVPNFVFLAGGFLDCIPLRNMVQQFLSQRGAMTLICNQPSTAISMGGARIMNTQSSRMISKEIAILFNGEKKIICKEGETLSQIRTLKFQFVINSQKRQLYTVQVIDGAVINEEVLFSPSFVNGISIRIIVLPFSSGVQTYFTWQYKNIVDQTLTDISTFHEFHLQAQDYMQLIDVKELDESFDCLMYNYSDLSTIDKILLVQVSQLLHFEHFYEQTDFEIEQQQCDLINTLQLIMKILADKTNTLLFNSKKFGVQFKILANIKYLTRKITNIQSNYNPQINHASVKSTILRLGAQVIKFSTQDFLKIAFPGNTVISNTTLILLSNDKTPIFTIQEPILVSTGFIRLGKGYINTLAQQVIWSVFNFHGITYDKAQIEIMGSHNQVLLQLKLTSSIPFQQFQDICSNLYQLSPVVALLGKSIITYDQQSYSPTNYQPHPAAVTLSAIGSNLIEYLGEQKLQIKNYYKLTYNNLFTLLKNQDLLYLSKHTLSIDVVMDLKNPYLDSFVSSNQLFSSSQNRIQTQLVIFGTQDIKLEAKLDTSTVATNSLAYKFVDIKLSGDFDQFSTQNCCDCDQQSFYNIPVLKINSLDKVQALQLCQSCLKSDVTKQLAQPYGQFITFKNEVNDDAENANTIYPIIQLGQVAFSSFKDVSPLLLRIYNQYLKNDNQFICCPVHKCAPIPYNQSNYSQKCQNSTCNQLLCSLCKKWHSGVNLCENQLTNAQTEQFLKNMKQCRKCGLHYEKSEGCNHISCSCGAHNCYLCQQSFQTSNQCYAHLTAMHGGCFDPID